MHQVAEACARTPERADATLDRGVWHQFMKLDYTPVTAIEDKQLAETAPTLIATVFDRHVLGKKEPVGTVEVLLASLVAGTGTKAVTAVVDKCMTLMHGDSKAGELRLQTLFVPDTLSKDASAKAAVRALKTAHEEALTAYKATGDTPPVVTPENVTATDGANSTKGVVPGTLSVNVLRAVDLYETEKKQDPIVELKLVSTAGGGSCSTEVARDSGTAPEWNSQFSMLCDDARVDMLEVTVRDGDNMLGTAKLIGKCKVPLIRYITSTAAATSNGAGDSTVAVVQPVPESFKLTDAKGAGFRGNIVLALQFTADASADVDILRALRSCCDSTGKACTGAIHMGAVALEGAPCVRGDVYTVVTSVDYGSNNSITTSNKAAAAATPAATVTANSGPATATSDNAVITWNSTTTAAATSADVSKPATAASKGTTTAGNNSSSMILPWNGEHAVDVMHSNTTGRVPSVHVQVMTKDKVVYSSKIPLAGLLLHDHNVLLERLLTFDVSEIAATNDSGGEVTLQYTMQFVTTPAVAAAQRRRSSATAKANTETIAANTADTAAAVVTATAVSSGYPIQPGELVIQCMKARNLPDVQKLGVQDPFVRLASHGFTADTDVHNNGGNHPVWNQSRQIPVADACTATVLLSVIDDNDGTPLQDKVIGQIEVSAAGVLAAMAAVARSNDKASNSTATTAGAATSTGTATAVVPKSDVKGRGNDAVELWLPLLRFPTATTTATKKGTNATEAIGIPAGELRCSFRFLPRDFLLQRELVLGTDDGENGPLGQYRYHLERKPGQLLITLHKAVGLQPARIGDRNPCIEATVSGTGASSDWHAKTKRQSGVNPVFDEQLVADILWTPQDTVAPQLTLGIVDKSFGGGRLSRISLPIAPYILHPRMPADLFLPYTNNDNNSNSSSSKDTATAAGLYCSLVYLPAPNGNQKAVGIDPDIAGLCTLEYTGAVHLDIVSAAGLSVSTRDPLIAARLCHIGTNSSSATGNTAGGAAAAVVDANATPFTLSTAVVDGKSDPIFNTNIHLPYTRQALAAAAAVGTTPFIDLEIRDERHKSKVVGWVQVPLFPLWLGLGHMTKTWYILYYFKLKLRVILRHILLCH
jgi:C2 domain